MGKSPRDDDPRRRHARDFRHSARGGAGSDGVAGLRQGERRLASSRQAPRLRSFLRAGPGRSARSLPTTSSLTAGGLWPRSRWLGSNWTRLPADAAARGEIAITIDDGPDPEVTPAVLDLLDRHQARATFFCIAEQRARPSGAVPRDRRAAATASRTTAIAISHRFSLLGPRAMAREIAAAQASLADITGDAPRFFRAPAGLRNPFLAPVLQRLDLQLVSWTRRGFDTVRRRSGTGAGAAGPAASAPATSCCCTTATRARDRAGRPVVLAVLPALLERVRTAGLSPVTLPARPVGRARRGAAWQHERSAAGARLARPGRGGERAVPARRAASPGTSRAASCAGIRCSATCSRTA